MKEQWTPTIGDEVIHPVTKVRAKITAFGKFERSAVLYSCNNTGCFHFNTPNIFEWELDNSDCVPPDQTPEEITKPERYNKKGKLECWDVILDQEMNFLEGNILKYIWRHREKNGVEDLKKARVYLDKLISQEEKK